MFTSLKPWGRPSGLSPAWAKDRTDRILAWRLGISASLARDVASDLVEKGSLAAADVLAWPLISEPRRPRFRSPAVGPPQVRSSSPSLTGG